MLPTAKKPTPKHRAIYIKQVSELGYVLVETDGVTDTELGEQDIKPLIVRRARQWIVNNIASK